MPLARIPFDAKFQAYSDAPISAINELAAIGRGTIQLSAPVKPSFSCLLHCEITVLRILLEISHLPNRRQLNVANHAIRQISRCVPGNRYSLKMVYAYVDPYGLDLSASFGNAFVLESTTIRFSWLIYPFMKPLYIMFATRHSASSSSTSIPEILSEE